MIPILLSFADRHPTPVGVALAILAALVAAMFSRTLRFITEIVRGYPPPEQDYEEDEEEDPADFWKNHGGES